MNETAPSFTVYASFTNGLTDSALMAEAAVNVLEADPEPVFIAPTITGKDTIELVEGYETTTERYTFGGDYDAVMAVGGAGNDPHMKYLERKNIYAADNSELPIRQDITVQPGLGVGEFTFDITIYHTDFPDSAATQTVTVKVTPKEEPKPEEPKPEEQKPEEPKEEGTNPADTSVPVYESTVKTTSPKTGDTAQVGKLLLFGISGIAIVALIKRKRAE